MVTVYNEEELKAALTAKEDKILVKGDFAEKIKKRMKRKKAGKRVGIGAMALGAVSLLAIPFTGGASALGVGAAAAGLTIGAFTISATELAILVFGGVALAAICKGYDKVKINSDGSVEISKKEGQDDK